MILCLGLAPALQRTLLFNSFELNEVNRSSRVVLSAAGKPLNTARAVAALGGESWVAGFNGGQNGENVIRFIDDYGVVSALTPMSAETRICSTLIDEKSGEVTEIVEEAPQPSDSEIKVFVENNIELIKRCRILVISGTLPSYADDDFYRHFTSVAAHSGIPVVIDSHKNALLSVLPDKPLMAKFNRRELEDTFGCAAENDDKIQEMLKRIIECGAKNVFMTQGKDAAWLVNKNETLLFNDI
jgi:1-phosphofructokinase family hexose kinase